MYHKWKKKIVKIHRLKKLYRIIIIHLFIKYYIDYIGCVLFYLKIKKMKSFSLLNE